MKAIALHLAILAVLASAVLLAIGFDPDGHAASADDFIYRACPTPTPGTPTPTNTPGGLTKTPTITGTPCRVKLTSTPTPLPPTITPTPPLAVGGVALGGGLAPGENDEAARTLWLAVLVAIAVALSGSAWYAHKRWIRR